MKLFKILAIRALSEINRSASPRVLNPIKHSCSYVKQYIKNNHFNETTNRSRGIAQVDHQSTSEHKAPRKSGINLQPSVQSELFNNLNKYSVLRIDEDDGDDDELRIIIEGKNTPDQVALNPTMSKKSIKNKSSGNGSSGTHKTALNLQQHLNLMIKDLYSLLGIP